jgi:hypothetical protein
MKSRILLSTLLLFLAIANCDAQTYMKTWYFSPNKVDMTAPAPSITTITGASTPVSEVANGAYDRMDPYGDAMFYITDDQVFDKNNNVIGVLSGDFRQAVPLISKKYSDEFTHQNRLHFNSFRTARQQ